MTISAGLNCGLRNIGLVPGIAGRCGFSWRSSGLLEILARRGTPVWIARMYVDEDPRLDEYCRAAEGGTVSEIPGYLEPESGSLFTSLSFLPPRHQR